MVLIAGCLGSEWCRDALRMSHLQGTVNLISRDVVEALALVSLRKTLPVNLCRLEQRQGSHHVGLSESEWILDTSIYMALGSEMDDAIHLVVLHQFQHQVEIADVALNECIIRLVLDVLEVSQVASVSQLVEVDDVILGYLFTKSLTTCEPMKPAPPVINILCILINVYIRTQITRIIQEKL